MGEEPSKLRKKLLWQLTLQTLHHSWKPLCHKRFHDEGWKANPTSNPSTTPHKTIIADTNYCFEGVDNPGCGIGTPRGLFCSPLHSFANYCCPPPFEFQPEGCWPCALPNPNCCFMASIIKSMILSLSSQHPCIRRSSASSSTIFEWCLSALSLARRIRLYAVLEHG